MKTMLFAKRYEINNSRAKADKGHDSALTVSLIQMSFMTLILTPVFSVTTSLSSSKRAAEKG